jgi:hypothetical protein
VLGLGRGCTNEIPADLMDRDGLLRALAGVRADVVHAAFIGENIAFPTVADGLRAGLGDTA